MAPLFRCLLLVLVIAAIACQRDMSRLDDVQKMAYSVKPAVVRISAYATAQFHYPPSSLEAIASDVGLPRRDGTGAGVVETDHPLLGLVRQVASPFRFDELEPATRRAPLRGEHTASVLRELCGYPDDRISELVANGVFGDVPIEEEVAS